VPSTTPAGGTSRTTTINTDRFAYLIGCSPQLIYRQLESHPDELPVTPIALGRRYRWPTAKVAQALGLGPAAELGYCSKGAACQDVQRALDQHNAEQQRREAEAREFRELVARWLRPQWLALIPRLARMDPVDLLSATGEGREVLRALGALHRALAELEDLGLLDDDEET
jgi:hypothetical protein